MLCKVCSTESDGDFCPNCGTPMEKTQSANNYYQPNQIPPVPQKKKNNGLMIALIVIGAVLIIGVFACIGLLAKDNGNNKATENETTVQTEEVPTEETTTLPEFSLDDMIGETVEYTGGDTDSNSNTVQPDFYYEEETRYIKPTAGLVLRKGPGTNYSKILTIKYAQQVTIIGGSHTVSGWDYVFYNGYYGWVSSQYLTATRPSGGSSGSHVDNRYTKYQYYEFSNYFYRYVSPSAGLNLRNGASTNSASVVVLPKNTEVTVMGYSAYDSDWYYVYAYYNGNHYDGFLHSKYLRS